MSDVIYQNLRKRFRVKFRADLSNPKRRQTQRQIIPKVRYHRREQRHPRGQRGDEPQA